ncbi:hypothetical protein FBU59_000749 [Linderina macrospora]|uniref:Uncharacterized protein n=1 Tax=Linderina macrospora TaxID=4868 RepID=A0ACC1JFY9_9FUNG|nr:hypothetical protein FBU59_000749 [Linderina macrospora]
MNSLVAATSDTVRVWDLAIASNNQQKASNYATFRRGAASSTPSYSISQNTTYTTGNVRESVNEIKAVSWSTDGSTFVVGGKGPYMRQFSASGEPLMDIPGNDVDISDIVAIQHYGGNSESVFIADNTSRQVRRWDFASMSFVQTCQTHDNDIACMSVSAKKRLVASATRKGGEITMYNLTYNTRTELRSATHRALASMDFSASARTQLMVGSEDGLLQLFDVTRHGETPVKNFAHVHSAPVCALKFHPANLNYVVSAGLDGKMVLTDTAVQKSNAVMVKTEAPLTCLACHQSPVVVSVGTIDGEVLVYDLRGPRTPLWRHKVSARKPVVSIDFSFEHNAMPVATGRRTAHHRKVLNQLLESAHRRNEPPAGNALGITSRQMAEELASPEDTTQHHDDEFGDLSMIAKDRSFMEMLSPPKPLARKPARADHRRKTPATHERREYADDLDVDDIHESLEQMHALDQTTDHRHDEDLDDEFDYRLAEYPRHAAPVEEKPVEEEPVEEEPAEETHDMGDSMMEMFTPEREKRRLARDHQDELDGLDGSPLPDKTPSKMVSALIAQLKSSQKKIKTIDLTGPPESRKPAPPLKTPGRENEFSAISPRSARSIEKNRRLRLLAEEQDMEPAPKRRAVQGHGRTPRAVNEPKSAKRSAVRFLSRAAPKYPKESAEEDPAPRAGSKVTSKYLPKPWMRHAGIPPRQQAAEQKEPPVFAAVSKRHTPKVARPLVRQAERSLDKEIRQQQRYSYQPEPEPEQEPEPEPEPVVEDYEEEGEEYEHEYVESAAKLMVSAAARKVERPSDQEYGRASKYHPRAVKHVAEEEEAEDAPFDDRFAKPVPKTPANGRRPGRTGEWPSEHKPARVSQFRPKPVRHEEEDVEEDYDLDAEEVRYKPKPVAKAAMSSSKVSRRLSDFESEPAPAQESAPPPAPPPPPPVRSAEQRPPMQKRASSRSAANAADISAKSPPLPEVQSRSQRAHNDAIPLAKVLVPSKQPPALPATASDISSSKQTATTNAPKPQEASAAGSPSVGTSVLQNTLMDALVPMREQIRGEIRNLHLDMIKQHFVVQEQLRGLQREAAESQALRQQIERLRKENERLMRYIPFHNMLDESDLAEQPGGPNGIARVSASSQQQQQHQQQHHRQQRR